MDLEQKLWESREDGIELGRQQGFQQWLQQGFQQGFEQGFKQGFEQGFEQGKEAERENFVRFLTALQEDGRESELPTIMGDSKLLDEEFQRYGIN